MAPFGNLLKHWRGVRRLSQLDLAQELGMSPRHVSFLETGRSRPTSSTVTRLAEGLDIPLHHRNALFAAAGLPGPYACRPLDAPELKPFRTILQRMLDRHEPYPAFVLDRHYGIVDANQAARRLFPDLSGSPVEAVLDPHIGRSLVANWEQVAWGLLHRIRREVPMEPGLAPLAKKAEDALQGTSMPPPGGSELAACPVLKVGDRRIRTVSAIARFDSALDPTAHALRVELMFPEDDEADAFFHQLAEQP